MADIKKILLVEDDPGLRGIRALGLRGPGRQVIPAESSDAALEAYAANKDIALLVTDHDLQSSLTGMEVIRELRGQGYKGPVILTSGNDAREKLSLELAAIGGDNAFLPKNMESINELRALVNEKLGQGQAQRR